ncbi:hypothetical protein [Mesorhizobium sp.]|uniref:hypothetical protein n=1 Tax=Mesorhizobium sp. TaxID=1871066 RepID=UPI000FE9B619|nr:hypothetical protein [Mesorhizobium sp.]RWI18148.1 MAG: hypothetical protein EOQ94_27420 [Mesorhizobium sp.]TIQ94151.1 MAG: hypothetical protein E5X36_27410 [Mesorhizobium sp.]
MRGQRALCDAQGIVLIADEVQSGLRSHRPGFRQRLEAAELFPSATGRRAARRHVHDHRLAMTSGAWSRLVGTYAASLHAQRVLAALRARLNQDHGVQFQLQLDQPSSNAASSSAPSPI